MLLTAIVSILTMAITNGRKFWTVSVLLDVAAEKFNRNMVLVKVSPFVR